MKKKLITLVLAACVLSSGCGGNKSKEQLTDIEQFKCQESIQTVFDVLGESKMENNQYIEECYIYENLNLYGYNGKAIFRVRNDKETISSFECNFNLNRKEFEDVLYQLKDKYGECEKSEYSNQIAYVWEIEEKKAEEIGYSRISLSDYGDEKVVVDFSDEWSIKTDEAYCEYLNKEKEINSEDENKETVDMFEYSYDDNNKISVILSKDKETGKMSVSSFCSYENGNLGIMQGDFVTIISTPFENGMDVGYFGTVGSETYSYIISNEKVLMDTITVNEVQEFPEEYKDKFDDMRNELAGFYKQYGIE